MSVLGAIRKISQFEMIVSLPNNLNGFVTLADVSDPLSEILSKKVQKGEVCDFDLHWYLPLTIILG